MFPNKDSYNRIYGGKATGIMHPTEASNATEWFDYYSTTYGLGNSTYDMTTRPTTVPATEATTHSGTVGLYHGELIGIVVGCFVILCGVIAVVVYCFRKKRKTTVEMNVDEKPPKKPSISAPQSALDIDGYLVPIDTNKSRISAPYEDNYVLPDTNIYYEIIETNSNGKGGAIRKKSNIYDTPEQIASPPQGEYLDLGK